MWQRLNTQDLACSPFEVVTARHLYFRVLRIQGSVTYSDTERTPLPHAQLVLRGLGKREQLEATETDEEGRFTFVHHAAGWYQLETCKDGFNSIVVPVQVTRGTPDNAIHLRVSIAN
jgi:hypothetical protein